MSAGKDKGERSLKDLLLKINHPLLDVRSRSLRSVVFKLTNNLIATGELAHQRQFIIHLLEWFNFEEWSCESQVLSLLGQLTKHATAAQTVVEVGGVEFLSQLRLHSDPALHPLIDEILEQLLKLPAATIHSPSLNTNISSPVFNSSTSSDVSASEIPHNIPSLYGTTTSNGTIGESRIDSSATTTPLYSSVADSLKSTPGSHKDISAVPSYSTLSTENTTDVGSYMELSRESFGLGTTQTPQIIPHVNPFPKQHLERSKFLQESSANGLEAYSLSGVSGSTQLSSWTESSLENERVPHLQAPASGGLDFPYSESRVLPDGEDVDIQRNGVSSCGRGGGIFPWLRLTSNDRNILATTQSRLESCTDESLLRTCEFIEDVLFQDFPTELFLQRPALIKCLIKNLEYHESRSSKLLPILSSLRSFIFHLHQRCSVVSDPSLGLKDKIGEEVTRSSAATHSPQESHQTIGDLEAVTCDVLGQLQSEQLSTTQFSLCVISSVSPLLPCFLNRDNGSIKMKQEMTSSKDSTLAGQDYCSCVVSQSVSVCLEILMSVVEIMCEPPPSETNVTACYEGAVDSLCSTISQCLSKWRRLAVQTSSRGETVSPQLQMVCSVTVRLFHCLCHVLEICRTSKVLPLPSVLNGLMMNGVLGLVCPTLQDKLLSVYESVDAPNARLFSQVKDLSNSFHRMSQFLAHCPASGSSLLDEKTVVSIISCALNGVAGLWFTVNSEFIQRAMELSFTVLSTYESVSHDVYSSGKELLLRLLGHGSDGVKVLAYKHLKDNYISWTVTVKESKDNTDIGDKDFHLNSDLLREVCCYGAVAKVDTIATASCQVVSCLVSLCGEDVWTGLWDSLLQWMPFIEVAMSRSELLCKDIQELLESTETGLTDITRLNVLTRLLFSNSIELRVWSFRMVTSLLLSGTGQSPPPAWFKGQSSLPLHDLLVEGAGDGGLLNKKSSFKHEDIVKLVHILRSPTMDQSLKISALEQMALILKDQLLHEQVLQDEISEDILSTLVSQYQDQPLPDFSPSEGPTSIVKPCLKCLGLLVHSSSELREKLSNDCTLLSAVLKAAMQFHDDREFLCCVSKLLTMSLFRSIVKVTEDGAIQLPEPFIDRLKYPFQTKIYDLEFCHLTPSPLDPKLFTSDPLLSMLRLNYHSAMIGCPESIINAHQNLCLRTEDENIAIPATDIVSMRSLSVQMMLHEYFSQLRAASSHDRVISILNHIEVVLNSWTLYGDCALIEESQFEWRNAIERFLTVRPSTIEDISLLCSVLRFLQTFITVKITSPHQPTFNSYLVGSKDLVWLTEVTCGGETMCAQFLQSSLESNQQRQHSDPQRLLLKEILHFFGSLIYRCSSDRQISLSKVDCFSSLTKTVCHCLDVAGCPDYYDLPLLEKSLECLLQLSSSDLMVWSSTQDNLQLLVELITSLRQVLWSFISGRGFKVASFMGRGVTSRASLSLAHIIQVFIKMSQPEGWWLQWLKSSPDIGLSWLHYLMDDRDPQVQYSSFSLLASLCSKTEVVEITLGEWSDLPFGLWGVCLASALDCHNSGLVRQQALYTLVNVSAVCNTLKKWSNYLTYKTDDSELPLNGEEALEFLLHAYKLFPVVNSIVQSDRLFQLRKEVLSSLERLGDRPDTTPSPFIKQTDPPLVDDQSLTERTFAHKGEVTHSANCDLSKNKQNTLSLENVRSVCELVSTLVCYCEPLIVSGVCRLLYNLVSAFPDVIGAQINKEGLLKTLLKLVDAYLLKLFILAASKDIIGYPLLSMWVKMYCDVLELLKALLWLQPTVAVPHLNQELVGCLWEMLTVVWTSQKYREDTHCLHLCSNILELLLVTVERGQGSPLKPQAVFVDIQKHWTSFTNFLLYSLEKSDKSPQVSSLQAHSLKTLSSVLVCLSQPPDTSGKGLEIGRCAELAKLVDCDIDGEMSGTHRRGSSLCTALMKAYDMTVSGTTTKRMVGETLGILLASSTTAKDTALANGFLESTVDQLKALGAKVKVESADQLSHSNKKKKDCPAMADYIAIIHLLRNFMYKSPEVKAAAIGTQLLTVIHKQWHWCSLNRKLLVPLLRMLTVLTAKYPQGQACIARPISTKVVHSSTSLFHSILKLSSTILTGHSNNKLPSSDVSVLGVVFSLLANCVLSQESRAVIRKVGFLSHLSSLNPKSEKSHSLQSTRRPLPLRLSSLWVTLLTNLSFSSEGQQMIIKQSGSLDILVDIYWSSCGDVQHHSLLILRNLCFYGPSKTLLASNELFLAVVSHCLDSDNKALITLAASAVWALLHNCAKIRNTLRQSELVESLDLLHPTIKSSPDNQTDDLFKFSEESFVKAVNKAHTLLH